MKRSLKALGVLASMAVAVLVLRRYVLIDEPVPVRVALAAPGRVEETVTNTRAGTVKARRRAKLSPEVGGVVVALPFREGERVSKGAVVLRLDDRLQRSELDLADKDLEAARSAREEARLAAERAARNLERIRRLTEEEIVSEDLMDRAETESHRARAALEAKTAGVSRAEAAVRLAKTRVEKMVLRAPFDAVVAEVDAEVGEWVTPSPPALPVPPAIDILDPGSIYVSAPMDEVDSARIASGQRVRVSVDSFPGRHFWGRVVRVAPYVVDVEAQNRTVEIEVDLDAEEVVSKLLPGTSADVEVLLAVKEHVLRVPTSSLIDRRRVLLVDDELTLMSRDVQIGLSNWDFTEVVDGLEPGDRVVDSLDRQGVFAGAKVKVEAEEGAP